MVGENAYAVLATDLNADGSINLAVSSQSGNVVRVLRDEGRGSFTVLAPLSVGSSPVALAAADLDGDKVLDLVVTSVGSGTVRCSEVWGKTAMHPR